MRSNASVTVPAFAKVNLGLEVLGQRQDGYHELRTIFQTIDLRDELTLRRTKRGITLECDDKRLPSGESNLAWRAARDLLRHARLKAGVHIELRKRIPVEAGLGGGSSDAASVLRGLDALFGLGLGPSELHRLARRLGADVPFFLMGGTALGLGRGDEVYPLRSQVDAHLVVVNPGRGVATAAVFKRIDASLTPRENSYSIFYFVSSDLEGAPSYRTLTNDLERASIEEAPELAQTLRGIRAVLLREGAEFVSLSGSGSVYYGLYDDPRRARTAQRELSEMGFKVWQCRTVTLDRYRRIWSRCLTRQGRQGSRAK